MTNDAQSNESILFGGLAFTAYQVNDRGGGGFFDLTFAQTGEIWLTTILQTPQQQWRLSDDSDRAKFENEPYEGRSKVWVFYSSVPSCAIPATRTHKGGGSSTGTNTSPPRTTGSS